MMKLRNIAVVNILLLLSTIFAFAQNVPDTIAESELSLAGIKSADAPDSLITAASYVFSAQSGISLEDMSSGTTQLIAAGSDNDNSVLGQIGFTFRFDGVFYTTFGANANGLIKLGGVTTTTNSLNVINSVTNAPKIMPYWDDLCVGSSGKVHSKTLGSPGSRKLVVEWTNMKISRGTGCDGSGGGTFQMWLFEHSGVVQFVYGNGMTAPSPTNNGYSIGIQSGAATNFASITAAGGTVSYATADNSQATAITAGASFLLSPNIPAAPTGGNANPIMQTSVTINWTDNATDETAYVVRRTTDNVNFSFVGNLGPNANTFTDTGLTPATQYFYYVNALSDGAFSEDLVVPVTTNPPLNITSTASGGPWSAPSTWVGGVVPDAADHVTIASGATVSIDIAAQAASVTIGSVGSLAEAKEAITEGGAPARLTFEETAGHSLTVGGNVTIGSNDIFSTGGGSANAHILSVGGNLTNNGTLDFSTNNNQAGATITFTGASNNTFGGTGAVTDVMALDIHKTNSETILELTVSNFTVRGSTTDTPGSGYLFLYEGIFKISGTFTGTHRTFATAQYNIPATAGFWLNNPNYTVAAQASSVGAILGYFRVSAGTLNVGTTGAHTFNPSGTSFVMEGGKINVTGSLGIGATFITIGGGTITACIDGPGVNGFVVISPPPPGGSVIMSGGDVVIQNSANYNYPAAASEANNLRGTTVHFGNALTNGPGTFNVNGLLPNVVIDTTAFPQSLTSFNFDTHVNNLNIGPGGIFQFPTVRIHGTTIVNNGQLKASSGVGSIIIDDLSLLSDVTFSGTGTMNGFVRSLFVKCNSLTFDPAHGNLTTYDLTVIKASVINAARITLGRNDTTDSQVQLFDGAHLDMPMDFNLGPNGERVYYNGIVTTGGEINPDRILKVLSHTGFGSVTIAGGDIITTSLQMSGTSVVFTGPHTITTQLGTGLINGGFVDGNLRMQFAPGHVNHDFDFPVGQNGLSAVTIRPSSIVNPSYLTIRAIDTTLPGLLPGTSASRYWKITEEGDMSAQLTFNYINADIRGNEANYKLWQSNGGTPVMIVSTANPPANRVQSTSSIGILTGDWGIGEMLDPGPVSISGSVTTSGGQPIANATMTISGGNLPAPVVTQTGSFGTYQFSSLQAGETYTIRVDAKRFRFTPATQQVTPLGNVGNVNFTANPQE